MMQKTGYTRSDNVTAFCGRDPYIEQSVASRKLGRSKPRPAFIWTTAINFPPKTDNVCICKDHDDSYYRMAKE